MSLLFFLERQFWKIDFLAEKFHSKNLKNDQISEPD